MNVDPRKSGASVNGKELKNDEMQRITNHNFFSLMLSFKIILRNKNWSIKHCIQIIY